MQKYSENLTTRRGDGVVVPLKGASVLVKTRAGATVSLYSDNGVTPMANPVVTDENGGISFYAANGRYDFTVDTGKGRTTTVKDVDVFDADDAPLPKFDDTKGVILTPDGKPFSARNPPFKVKTQSQILTGRKLALAPFKMASVVGNGQQYTAAQIDSQYPNGIPGVLERITSDVRQSKSTTSAIATADMGAWRVRVQPTHLFTNGRPRTLIIGQPLEFDTLYRFFIRIALPQGFVGAGWGDKNVPSPLAAIFALSQQGGDNGVDYSAGQLSGAASPLYMTLHGTTLYPEIRTIEEGMAMRPGDLNYAGAAAQWGYGDTIHTCSRVGESRTLHSTQYHRIVLDVFMDETPLSEGGRGFYRATFNGAPWFDFDGATAAPRNAQGQRIPFTPRIGFYEVSGVGDYTPGLLCSSVPSCAVERGLDIAMTSYVMA